MKILHLISSMNPELGGVCQAVRTIIAGLTAQDVHNEVASLDAAGMPWEQNDPFTIHALGPSRNPWHYSAKLLPWLLGNLMHFDVVILHGMWLYQGYAISRTLHRLNAKHLTKTLVPKLFIMPHGMLDPYFQHASGRQLKAWRNQIYWKLIENAVVNQAEGVLFTCETERILARQPFTPYRPQREIVVGLGVKHPPLYATAMREAFYAQCSGLQNRPYILFLSRIHEKKGVELLLRAYAQMSRRLGPSVPALVIAGPGIETCYGQRMRQLATEIVETAAVFFPGMLTGDVKWGAVFGCEVFVLPSHQENFGIAVVEALACSKPVLISNQVNIWREITAAGGGLVADDTLIGTEQVLMQWQGLSPTEKQVMGTQAYNSFITNFAVESATAKLLLALSNT